MAALVPRKRQESPVIVITGYKLEPADEDLKPAVVLEKPFHVAELLDMVGLFCGLGTPIEPRRRNRCVTVA